MRINDALVRRNELRRLLFGRRNLSGGDHDLFMRRGSKPLRRVRLGPVMHGGQVRCGDHRLWTWKLPRRLLPEWDLRRGHRLQRLRQGRWRLRGMLQWSDL
jgi:hypothetical protein